MKALLLSTLFTVLRAYVGGGLFDRIAAQVRDLSGTALTGQERMAMVLSFAARESATLGETLVRAVVEIVLLKDKP